MTVTSIESDLFTEQTTMLAPVLETRITCRVCDRKERVPHNHPALLCLECLADVDATARHVAKRTASVYVRWQREYEAFERMVKDNPWWEKVVAARYKAMLEPDYAVTVARAWAAARNGPNAAIVAARDALDTTSAEVEQMTKWYVAAENELRAARDAGLGGI